MILITRKEIEIKLNIDVSRMRNYELEQKLWESTREEYCVAEWCPFNGVFCKYLEFCRNNTLQYVINANRGKGVVNGINLDYIADYCQDELDKRKTRNDN